MKVGLGVVAIAVYRVLRFGELVASGIVDDEAELLLRDVAFGPGLAFLRQEYTTNKRRQLLIMGRHQLQWRVAVGEAQRTGAAFIRTMRMNLGVHAPVHDMIEDIGAE